MGEGKDRLANPGGRLPDLGLPAVGGGARVEVRGPRRRAPVLALLHGGECGACLDYLRRLCVAHAEIAAWDGWVAVVTDGEGAPLAAVAASAGVPVPVLADGAGALAAALDVETPAVAVADQWGVVHLAAGGGAGHALPAPEELADWARFLAVQCPECEGEAL